MTTTDRKIISKATIISAGDLLISESLLRSAYRGDGYDFSPIFKFTAPYIKAADYSVINLETSIGKDGNYCGFPRFKSQLRPW